jgi:hypothetical protein
VLHVFTAVVVVVVVVDDDDDDDDDDRFVDPVVVVYRPQIRKRRLSLHEWSLVWWSRERSAD